MHLFHHALHIDRNGLTHVHHEAAGNKARIYEFRLIAKTMLGRHTDLFKRDKSAYRMANVENKATKSCTPIYEQMDRPKPGKEGGYGNGANSSSPAYCNFFLGGESCFQEPTISPSLVAKKRARQIEKKSRSFSGRTFFFWVKGGRGIQGQEKDRGRERERERKQEWQVYTSRSTLDRHSARKGTADDALVI